MKTKLTSVLVCVLLSTTLGHDYHRAKHLAHGNRRSHHLSHFHERVATPPSEQCQWVCEDNSSSNETNNDLKLLVNETSNLVGIVNITAEVALVLDLNADLVALFNGTSGEVIIVNIKSGSGVYITAKDSNSGWLSSQESFEVYFRRLTSLQVFLDLKVGTTFTASSISSQVSEVLGNLLGSLSTQIGLQIGGQLERSLRVLLKISGSLSAVLRNSLGGLLALIGETIISLGGDLLWLVNVLEGLGTLLEKIPGGLAGLIKAGVKLDIPLLLRSTDGIEFLINLLLSIVRVVDLSVLGDVLNSLENLTSTIAKLGGNVSTGLNGLLKVVSNIIALINGHISIDVVINVLIEFAASRSTHIDISASIEGLLTVLRIQGSLHSSSSLSGFISIVEQLQNGTLVAGGINVSAIINILAEGASNGIELIVSVIMKLSEVVKPEVAILKLVANLITELNTTLGVRIVESLIPGLSIKVSVSGGIDLKALIQGLNIGTITQLILSGNINDLLKTLPVIKDIYAALSQAVSSASNGSLSLEALISGPDARSILSGLITWISRLLGISGSVSVGPIVVTLKPGIGGGHGPVVTGGHGPVITGGHEPVIIGGSKWHIG